MSLRWVAGARVGVIVAVVTLMAPRAMAQNLVVNGSFETPAIANNSYQVFTTIPGWSTSLGSGIEVQNNPTGVGLAFDGVQQVELDSFGNSGMQQTVPTTSGQAYVLRFEYSPRPGYPLNTNGIEVRINDTLLMTVARDGTGLSTTQWTSQSLPFTATGSTVVDFRAVGTNDALGGLLDAVTIATAPSVPALPIWALASVAALFVGTAGARIRMASRANRHTR